MISSLYYGSLINKIFEKLPNVSWEYASDFRVITECDVEYPNLFFMFENHWIEVSAENYVYHEQDDLLCTFLIMPVDLPTNMFGMPMFMDYYTVFDQKQDSIGWAPYYGSGKARLTRVDLPPASQYLEAYAGPGVMPEQVHLPSVILSWVFGLVLFYGSYFHWNRNIKPAWKGLLSSLVYQISTGSLLVAMIGLVAFLM